MKEWVNNSDTDAISRQRLLDSITDKAENIGGEINLMEVCGTHTMAISRAGLRSVLPDNINLISGPGCPVCVTSRCDIDRMIALTGVPELIVTTFGDMMKVPGSRSTLAKRKESGADVRVVYSPRRALDIARENPSKQVVFIAVGFETTIPAVAGTLEEAVENNRDNFRLFVNHKFIPPALEALFSGENVNIDGLLCPGHVSTIIGSRPYNFIVDRFNTPAVIAGFEAADILKSVNMLLTQLEKSRPRVEIQYQRCVQPGGNPTARRYIKKYFRSIDCDWRGLGVIPDSGAALRENWAEYDIEKRIDLSRYSEERVKENSECSCGDVLRGLIQPPECPQFGRGCTPLEPLGPCMVSGEGACAAYYKYGRGC